MFNIAVEGHLYSNKTVLSVLRFFEFIKLTLKRFDSSDNSKDDFPFIANALAKGHTVLDIGCHKKSYFFDLFKLSKFPGKFFVLESCPETFGYLIKRKKLLNLENVMVEQLPFFGPYTTYSKINAGCERENSSGATVIDFRTRVNTEEVTIKNIDSYCAGHVIIPALIKLNLEGNGLDVLQGAREILRKYKPNILIESSLSTANQETLLSTFKFLTDLNYSGYFILSDMKIPLASFDFNIYQNEILGFYCNNFFFE